jgi:hypothetical protein
MPPWLAVPGLGVAAFVRGLNNNKRMSPRLVVSLSLPTDPAVERLRLPAALDQRGHDGVTRLG